MSVTEHPTREGSLIFKHYPEGKGAESWDRMFYLTNIASMLCPDPIDCAKQKIEIDATKYPSQLVKGSAKKYTEDKHWQSPNQEVHLTPRSATAIRARLLVIR